MNTINVLVITSDLGLKNNCDKDYYENNYFKKNGIEAVMSHYDKSLDTLREMQPKPDVILLNKPHDRHKDLTTTYLKIFSFLNQGKYMNSRILMYNVVDKEEKIYSGLIDGTIKLNESPFNIVDIIKECIKSTNN